MKTIKQSTGSQYFKIVSQSSFESVKTDKKGKDITTSGALCTLIPVLYPSSR